MLKTLAALAALAVASALVLPTVGQAQDLISAQVSYADLDLATDGGKAALQQRIARAAKSVCGTPDLRDVTATRMVIECRQRAIAGSQPALHAALAAAQQRGSAAFGAAVLTVTAR